MENQKDIPQLRFHDFNGEWEMKKLGELSTINPTTSKLPEKFIYIDLESVDDGELKEVDLETYNKNSKGLNENTLLISINGTIGNVAKYQNEKVMLGKSVGYFNFKENTNFYYYLLNTDNVQNFFISELTGTTIKNLSLKTLRDAEFLLPSLSEQTKIANFLSAIDDKINYTQKQIENPEAWKKGLLQQMFV